MFSTVIHTTYVVPKWTQTKTRESYQYSDHAPDAYWLEWTSTHLPDRIGFFITDIDTLVRDKDNNTMFLEIKRKGRKCAGHQKNSFSLIHRTFMDGLEKNNNRPEVHGNTWTVTYYGFHLLTFENTTFENGRVYWNGKEVTEAEVIKRLSFQDKSLIVSIPR